MALYAEAAAGRLSLEERLPVGDPVGGTGVLRHLREAHQLTLHDLAMLTIIVSDNAATNRLIQRLGADLANGYRDAWGCPRSRLRWKMFNEEATRAGRDKRRGRPRPCSGGSSAASWWTGRATR